MSEPLNREEILWTPEEVAAYLRVSDVTVKNWVKRNQIPHVKAGSLARFRKADVDEWLEREATAA